MLKHGERFGNNLGTYLDVEVGGAVGEQSRRGPLSALAIDRGQVLKQGVRERAAQKARVLEQGVRRRNGGRPLAPPLRPARRAVLAWCQLRGAQRRAGSSFGWGTPPDPGRRLHGAGAWA